MLSMRVYIPAFLLLSLGSLCIDLVLGANFITRSGTTLYDGPNQITTIVGWNIPNLFQVEDRDTAIMPAAIAYEQWDLLKSSALMGVTVVRVYPLSVCCTSRTSDTTSYHVSGVQTLNEDLMKAVDEGLALAAKENVRVIFSFIDWWSYRGGLQEFAALRGKSKQQFYTDSQVIADFKWLINAVLTRTNTVTGVQYKNDPTIFAWETGNELSLYDSTPLPPASWTLDIASYIKSIDGNHLVMDGTNGVSGYGSTAVNVWGQLTSSGVLSPNSPVDIFTNHYYACSGPTDFGNRVLSDAQAVNAQGRAFIVGEFGGATQECYANLLDTIQSHKGSISGALMWSLRGHARDSGFYRHNEGSNSWWSYHVPGFPPTTDLMSAADEIPTVALMRKYAGLALGNSGAIPINKASAPILFDIPSPQLISWLGVPFGLFYEIWRANVPLDGQNQTAVYQPVASNVTDAHVYGNSYYSDNTASCGVW
ncbi:hypothetical protein HDU76_001753 [Blyttiomyces sp. JEL0837]|nr:hypothetical protein HDU76_001753 [Blyttiomyces sp. JEL0837]